MVIFFGQKIIAVLVNILLPHHPHFPFRFYTAFHFSHTIHANTLLEFKKDQEKEKDCLLFWHPRDKVLSAELVRTVLENRRNSMLLTESLWPHIVYLHLSLQKKITEIQHLPFRKIRTEDKFR